jgi:hypothetical protein
MRQSTQFLLPQHISGTNMPIIRSTISEYLPLLIGHTWKGYSHYFAYLFQVWPPKSGSYLLIVLLMMGILVPETC